MIKKLKRILLIGGSGQLGWKIRQLLAYSCEVISPNRIELNLLDGGLIRRRIQEWKPDIIINAAAYTAVDQAENESKLAFFINAEVPRIISEEAEKQGSYLIHYSTDYVFDGRSKVPYKEDDTPNPINVYGESKLNGELAIQEVMDKYLILRTSWVYGHKGKNFLNTMLNLFQERKEIRVVDDQIGSPTSVSMLAEKTILILQSISIDNNTPKGLYHLTSAGSTSWFGFSKKILEESKWKDKVVITPILSKEYISCAKRPAISLLDNNKIISELSIIPVNWRRLVAPEIKS
ncbi:dTDP-4-dehydrorhamnose reductase [bacterium]|jgi:dTDP-4-dehydrorhamnose reductase|nr:dTDP-4-dehydrorhamnose reductase [bacterium]